MTYHKKFKPSFRGLSFFASDNVLQYK
jgi:hypothetical protein